MARLQRDSKLDTRTARLRLLPKKGGEPYWRVMEEGRALGYRPLGKGKPGTWIARRGDNSSGKMRYSFKPLGNADDYSTADGESVLTFAQAQEAARTWIADVVKAGGKVRKPLTVKEAFESDTAQFRGYLASYKTTSGRGTDKLLIVWEKHILPTFGHRLISELTKAEIDAWKERLVHKPAGRRTSKAGNKPRSDNVKAAAALAAKRPRVNPDDPESLRRRQASVNRVLATLKAILNHAFKADRVDSDTAWRRVSPFKGADQPKVRHLEDDEANRLVAACEPDFRALVVAALLTGADYGELRTAKVSGFDPDKRELAVSKKRGPHTVALTPKGVEHFKAVVKGKSPDDFIFSRENGEPWEDSHQVRRMRAACERAEITPAINYHILRHTFATRALRRGMPMHYVSRQLGHKNILTTQRHYAHIIPADVAAAITAAMGDLDFSTAESA